MREIKIFNYTYILIAFMIFIYYNISQWSLKNQTLTELSFATAAACRKKKKSCREFTYILILTTRYIFLHCVLLYQYIVQLYRRQQTILYTHYKYVHIYNTISPLWPLAVTAKQLTSSKCSFCRRCVVHKYVQQSFLL